MRIIGGELRGRRLATVRGDLRPTADRLRESLFNVIGARTLDSVWIDLFAGTGAVGIEALSRGAAYVIFNDRDPAATRLLEKNLEICGLETRYEIHRKDVFVLLKEIRQPRLDFVFLDPPYDFARYRKLLDRVSVLPGCGPATTIILEVFKKTGLEELSPGFSIERTIRCGDSVLHFIRREPPEISLVSQVRPL